MQINGTAASDTLTGTTKADTFDLSQGGDDTASGLGGSDVFEFAGTFTADDHIDGGAGHDELSLDGDYSALLKFDDTTMVNIETIVLAGGHDYDLATSDANLADGAVLKLDASALTAGDTFTFDGSAELDGVFRFVAGDGTYHLTGADHVIGHDYFAFGDHFTNADSIDGKNGTDHLVLNGDYAGGKSLTLQNDAMANIEVIALRGGHDYKFVTAGNYAFGKNHLPATFTAFGFSAGDHFVLNDRKEHYVQDRIFAGLGTYNVSTGNHKDFFDFGGTFSAANRINGGSGSDILGLDASFLHTKLNADYTGTHALTFGAHQLTGIETLGLTGGFDYDITMADGNVAANHNLTVAASGFTVYAGGTNDIIMHGLEGKDRLTFDGSAETDGRYIFDADFGLYHLTGGAKSDTFNFTQDFARTNDAIDGGGGRDTVHLNGGANVVMNANTFSHIEVITLGNGYNYNLTTNNATVAHHGLLTVDASDLGMGDRLTFNGSAETDGRFLIYSGNGRDSLTGGTGADIFDYSRVGTNNGATRDTIHGFDFANDTVNFHAATAIDSKVTSGALFNFTFDQNLADAMQGHLVADHAILFRPDAGDQAGRLFLVVNSGGHAGYQAGVDLVIELKGALHGAAIDVSDFTDPH